MNSFLEQMTIEGFKSIKKQTISLTPITVIIGANGAGKSNFISFFKMLNAMMSGALQTFIGKEGTAQSLLYFGPKVTSQLKAALKLSNGLQNEEYRFTLAKAAEDMLVFSEELMLAGKQKCNVPSGFRESKIMATAEKAFPENRLLKSVLTSSRFFQFHDTSVTANMRNNAFLENNKSLMSDAGNLAAFLYMLKNKSEDYRNYYDRIVEKIRYVLPQFDNFVLEPKELNEEYISLNWREKDTPEYIFGSHQLSDGALRFMALATLLLQPPDKLPGIIVIDEPELGLHPQAVDLLGKMIMTASKNAQIIVATQSPRLLDNFDIENIIVAERDSKEKCSVFKRLNEEELAAWLDEYSLSQLWDKNLLGGQP